jgi:hypothetical protein
VSQKQIVLDHLLAGKTLTPLKARAVYRIERLAARIFELKKAGHNIVCTVKLDESGREYAEYRMLTRDRFGRKKAA